MLPGLKSLRYIVHDRCCNILAKQFLQSMCANINLHDVNGILVHVTYKLNLEGFEKGFSRAVDNIINIHIIY